MLTLLTLHTLPAAAAAHGKLTLTAAPSELRPGDTFTLTVDMSDNPGIWSVAFDISLDTDAFEYVSDTAEGCIPLSTMLPQFYNEKTHTFRYNCFHSNYFRNMEGNGKLITVTYRVKDDAASGTYEVGFELDAKNTINVDSDRVAFDTVSTTLTVTAVNGGNGGNSGGSTNGGEDTNNGGQSAAGPSPDGTQITDAPVTAAPVTGEPATDDPVTDEPATAAPGDTDDADTNNAPADTDTADTADGDSGDDNGDGGDTLRYIIVWFALVTAVLIGGTAAVIVFIRRRKQ